MTAPPVSDRRQKSSTMQSSTMKYSGLVIAILGIALVAGGFWYAGASTKPTNDTAITVEPPDIDTQDVDPAVVNAVRSARTEVTVRPQSPKAWGRLGMVLLAHEFDDAAAKAFAEAQRLDPEEPRWAYFHARSVIRLQPADAVPLLKRAAELAGETELAPQLRLFELYLELDQPDDAQQPLQAFLQKHPDNARAHVAMARLAQRRGDLDLAESHLNSAAGDRAALKPVRELRAEILQRRGQRDQAEAERRLAASTPAIAWPDTYQRELGPLRVGMKVLLDKANDLYDAGRADHAATLAQQIVKQYHDSEWAWIILGRAQIRLRLLNDADVSLRQALKINPESVDARFRLGVIKMLRGETSKAMEFFSSAIETKPDHPVAHYNLGICYEKKEDRELAKKHYRKAIEFQPDYFEPRVKLADMLITEEQYEEARQLLTRALELKPDDNYAQQRLLSLPDSPESGAEPAGE